MNNLAEIDINYEQLFDYAEKISNLKVDFVDTLTENDNNGGTAYTEDCARQILDYNSCWGVEGERSSSIPKTLELLISSTSKLFNDIAQETKDKDYRISKEIAR